MPTYILVKHGVTTSPPGGDVASCGDGASTPVLAYFITEGGDIWAYRADGSWDQRNVIDLVTNGLSSVALDDSMSIYGTTWKNVASGTVTPVGAIEGGCTSDNGSTYLSNIGIPGATRSKTQRYHGNNGSGSTASVLGIFRFDGSAWTKITADRPLDSNPALFGGAIPFSVGNTVIWGSRTISGAAPFVRNTSWSLDGSTETEITDPVANNNIGHIWGTKAADTAVSFFVSGGTCTPYQVTTSAATAGTTFSVDAMLAGPASADGTTWFAVGFTGSSPTWTGRVYKSTNGGLDWSIVYTAPATASSFPFRSKSVTICSDGSIIAVLADGAGADHVVRSTNGGSSWTQLSQAYAGRAGSVVGLTA